MLRIKEIRKLKKITAKELAEQVNVAESTMSLYENGKREPDFETLSKIARFLEVSTDYLLGLSENSATSEQKEKPSPEGESDEAMKVALFGGDTEVTDEMWREVLNYAEFIKQKYNKT